MMQSPGHTRPNHLGESWVLIGGGDQAGISTLLAADGLGLPRRVASSTKEAVELVHRGHPEFVVWAAGSDFEATRGLFQELAERYPDVLRIVACADSLDVRDVFRQVPCAHQVLTLDPKALSRGLARIVALRAQLRDPETRRVVLSSNQLPATPSTYSALQAEIRNPRCSVLRVAQIIEGDVAVRARLLQMVASAFLGLPRNVSSVGGSIAYLGLRTISALVLSAEIGNCFRFRPIPGFSPERVSERCLAAARMAKRILAGSPLEEYGFVAALFLGVGQLVLAARAPQTFEQALRKAAAEGIPQLDAEQAVIGTNHALVGGYLLAAWGLPMVVAEAVIHQDHPELCDEQMGVSTAVYISRRLAADPAVGVIETPPDSSNALSRPHLVHVGAFDALAGWRDYARSPTN